MPLELFSGLKIHSLLADVQRAMGEDAVILSLRRATRDRSTGFELLAADPETAGDLRGSGRPFLLPAADSDRRPARHCPPQAGQPVIVALVGPTGSGKTTTIAKLANHPAAFGSYAVGLVSLDTYRVGALEQSRIYAELSRLPLEVVYEPSDIERALRRLRECDVLLVDTAGRGPSRQFDAAAMQTQLSALDPYEVHLTLPAGLQPQRARRIVEEYRPYGITHVIPTKIDECPGDEAALQAAAESSLPVLWMTNGQEVPGDLCTISGRDRTQPPAEPSPLEDHLLETA